MSRRASSSIHPFWIVAGLLLVVGAIAGGYVYFGQAHGPYRTITVLDVAVYLENANSLRGNTYKVTGTIMNSLAWSPQTGRLFSIEVKTDSGLEVLPLFIPGKFNHINIQKGQQFHLKIEIDDKGLLKVQDLQKT